ncbi:MAG: hypothetical protein MJ072_04005, partial [Clostridia bacterium]|nr:hypothetical protein [Clostridia bacterium]
PYALRTNVLEVTDTNQLFYAITHGYKPLPQTGSIAETVFNAALNVSRSIISDEMTDVEKLWAIYEWEVRNVSYDYGAVNYTAGAGEWTECKAWFMEGVFLEGSGVCDAISKSFSLLAGIENIRCGVAQSDNHAWNKVYVDGDGNGVKEWYVIDVTHANLGVGNNEIMDISHFLYTDGFKATKYGYIQKNYVDCPAETDFNVAKFLHYSTTKNNSNDFYIETYTEMKALVTHYKSSIQGAIQNGYQITLQIIVAPTYNDRKGLTDAIFELIPNAACSTTEPTYWNDMLYVTAIIQNKNA